ncbi:uncharacterized protein [Leptinotarsa decemlineata]|uniref:uncharacterized protein n=1 Tax=Leptinotarsa decemlineata TaxID=7539 RepID=UPI003D30D090
MNNILEAVIIGGGYDDDIEDAILFEILNEGENAVGNRAERYGRFDLNELVPAEVKNNFRFDKDNIIRLARALGLPNEIVTQQRHRISGLHGLCILLRRLAYPNRLCDLEPLFGLSAQSLSQIANEVADIIYQNHGHLIENLQNLPWLNLDKLRYYSHAVFAKDAPLNNCWGFIDGTTRAICRPTEEQENYYSGHKRYHCVKYQSLLSPDGLILSLKGAYPGRRHDAGIFRISHLYDELDIVARFPNGENFVLYGDLAYGIRDLLICPYGNQHLTPQQQEFNRSMSAVRQAVEWGFQKVTTEFAFLDFKKNQKLLVQDIEQLYKVAVLLTNCHTSLYGSQTSQYFNVVPPNLEEYLGV